MTAPTLTTPDVVPDMATLPEAPVSPAVPAVHAESWALVQRAQAGDADAFAEIYTAHSSDIYLFLLRHTNSHQLAEDLASDVWLKALRSIGSLRYMGRAPIAWLFTIARNRLTDYHRCGPGKWEVVDDDAATADHRDTGSDVEETAADRADRAALMAAIKRLTEPQQQAIHLTYFRGLSSIEVGQLMSISPEAVKALTLRARRQLIKHLPADMVGSWS